MAGSVAQAVSEKGIEDLPLHGGRFSDRLRFYDKQTGKAMFDEELKSELERLRNENADLKKGSSTASAWRSAKRERSRSTAWGAFP